MTLISRRQSTCVQVGEKLIGGDSPILVQSMTNTDTADPLATAAQIRELWQSGSEIVRITVNTKEAAQSVPEIVSSLEKMGICPPLVGDFHYNGHILLKQYPDCARLLSKYRINPGNVGHGNKHDENFRQMIEVALRFDKPVRIGVNWGSLDAELLSSMMDDNARLAEPLAGREVLIEAVVGSALKSASLAESYGMKHDRLILSAKVS